MNKCILESLLLYLPIGSITIQTKTYHGHEMHVVAKGKQNKGFLYSG